MIHEFCAPLVIMEANYYSTDVPPASSLLPSGLGQVLGPTGRPV